MFLNVFCCYPPPLMFFSALPLWLSENRMNTSSIFSWINGDRVYYFGRRAARWASSEPLKEQSEHWLFLCNKSFSREMEQCVIFVVFVKLGFKWLNVEWLFVPDGLVWVFQKLLIYCDFHEGLQRMVWKRENIQWAAVVWTKMLCWCQRSEENGKTR